MPNMRSVSYTGVTRQRDAQQKAASMDSHCSLEHCDGKHYARGYCRSHYGQMRYKGAFRGDA